MTWPDTPTWDKWHELEAERDRLRVALTNIRTHDYDNDHVDICFHQIMLEVDQALNKDDTK